MSADITRFLNRITDGHLLFYKAAFASVIIVLAGLQVLLAAGLYGRLRLAGSPETAARLHRWNGRLTLYLAVLVGGVCVITQAGPTSPTRVFLHSVFGTLLFVLLAAKFTVLRLTKSGQNLLPVLGISLFITFGAIWATSVADYISAT